MHVIELSAHVRMDMREVISGALERHKESRGEIPSNIFGLVP